MGIVEFQLAPRQAARLFRHAAIASRRQGRCRSEAVSVTWYDAGDAGELLAEAGRWRLERPARRYGLPAGCEVAADAQSPALIEGLGDERPAALVGFEGRRRVLDLLDDGQPVQLTVLGGRCRDAQREWPCCRVWLEGEDRALTRVASALGETLLLGVATCSFAQEAVSVSRGSGLPVIAPAALPAEATVDEAIRAIIGPLALAICRLAQDPSLATTPELVHQMRVSIRRLRSAMLVFKRPLGGALDGLRPALVDLASCLGAARDWDVFLGGTAADVQRAMTGDGRIGSLIAEAERARAASYAMLNRRLASAGVRRLLLELALLPLAAPWRQGADADLLAMPVREFAPRILDRRYKRMIGGVHEVSDLASDALHDTRKSGKTLRYALEFFAIVLPRGDTRRFTRRLSKAQDELGAINDGRTGTALLAGLTKGGRHEFASGAVLGWLTAQAAAARAPLDETWRRLRRQDRFWRHGRAAES